MFARTTKTGEQPNTKFYKLKHFEFKRKMRTRTECFTYVS